MSHKIINIPNALTLYRLPAGIAILWLMMQYGTPAPEGGYPVWITITIAIVSFLTFISDLFDGHLARSMKIVTNFGKIMDPVADSMFFTLLMLGLAMSPRFGVPIWFTVIMLYREAGVQIIRRSAALKGVVLMAGWAGKLKMVVQCIGMAFLGLAILSTDTHIYQFSETFLQRLAWWASCLSALVGILSLAAYVKQLPQMMQEQKENQDKGVNQENLNK